MNEATVYIYIYIYIYVGLQDQFVHQMPGASLSAVYSVNRSREQ